MNEQKYRENLKVLGLKIAYYRKLKELTQEQLADELNVSWSTISKVETGASGTSLRLLWDIADVLDIDVIKLLEK